MRNVIRSLWAEPRAPEPPTRVWRDWLLVAVFVPTAILEALVREDLVWRPLSLVLVVASVFTLLWRRTHPLIVVVAAFGATAVAHVVAISSGVRWTGLDTNVLMLLLPYALFRWGSGREAVIGLAVMSVSAFLAFLANFTGWTDVLGGSIVLLFPAALGASVRYQDNARLREREQAKLLEREQLARELHDTVAHHVSAIAIQAQAGRTLAASRPDAAVDALEVIEEAASRTLAEMRSMVGALRRGGEPDLAPQAGVADIERLARSAGDGPRVAVELSGDLDDLRPAVDAAIYRLAQESITNAIRHARNATRVDLRIAGDSDCVRLTVSDDGEASGFRAGSTSGYGLVIMTERAKLLGGTIEAGPSSGRGWTVDAVLPRNGTAR